MDALNPAKRRAAQRPTPQRVYVKVTSEFDATGYMQPRAITCPAAPVVTVATKSPPLYQ